MTTKTAALRMMDFFLSRARKASQERLQAMHALVAAYPDVPPGTPDFHVSMNFECCESDFGGSSWRLRGVQLRGGVLQVTTGHGNSDGMCGSDQFESPAEDAEDYLSALGTDPARMSGPFL